MPKQGAEQDDAAQTTRGLVPLLRTPARLMAGLLLFALLVGVAFVFAQQAGRTPQQLGPITRAVLERGYLICGVTDDLPGFGALTDAGEFAGFDIDFCRAVAAAMLGDSAAVEFVVLIPEERAAALSEGRIDMLSRNTTWTYTRDAGAEWDAIFGPTTFYDGQGIMVLMASGIRSLRDLAARVLCTARGTTTIENMLDVMEERAMPPEIIEFDEVSQAFAALLDGQCDAFTTDRSGLEAYRATAPDPGQLVILDTILSKEPLGPLSPQSDPQFADIVRWTVYGMIQAEETGITSQNIDAFMNSPRRSIQRLLGLNDTPSGVYMGIPNDFMVQVIRQVGNYGEVFERHLTPLGLQRGLNDLWINGGLLYAPPFR
ncbi:MAG: amino acid ABC transporter substrate-binding protein [Chloroflexi bacterium]|nr:amino acid ABC transporter substrate-binding protein [Chloroflexota bacterium]